MEFVQSKADCYCGIRSIKKRLQELIECAKCLKQIEKIKRSGDNKFLDEFCTMKTFSKIFRNIIHKEYYEEKIHENFTEQKTKKEFEQIIDKFKNSIADAEVNVCELCHQLNNSTEMATVTQEAIEKYSKYF